MTGTALKPSFFLSLAPSLCIPCQMWIRAMLLGLLCWPLFCQAAPHPDTCIEGFVWREAYPGDHVCVTPAVRELTAVDNQLAASRRDPAGGAHGPDTCKPGFVWREARPDDHVCVTPDVRERTARENRLAPSRRLMPPAAKNGGHAEFGVRGAMSETLPGRPNAETGGQPSASPPPPPAPVVTSPDVAASSRAPSVAKERAPASRQARRTSAPKRSAPRSARFKLPEFPWPPPPYSTRLKIERSLLTTDQAEPSNGSVAARMERALAANGYTQISYYAVPNGFAMVTQIERMDPDAAPAVQQRWSTRIDPVSLIPFDLKAYLQALLGKNGDSFRVIVFTFTPTPFTTSSQPVPPAEAMAWVEKGATALPAALAAAPYDAATICNALVYEFRISSLGAGLQRPSAHDGTQHLRAAGILTALEQQP